MSIEPHTIDTEDEARAYLTDLMKDSNCQSQQAIEARCSAELVPNPAIRAFFLAEGAKMLADRER
ncbi:hypothetical protein [Methylobacterium fujisawaense]